MGFARRHAADLRNEARRFRAMGLTSVADDRDKQAETFEQVADAAEAEDEISREVGMAEDRAREN